MQLKIEKFRGWAIMYVVLIFIASLLNVGYNVLCFGILLVLAIPFVKRPEYLLAINILCQTISYYYFGADEGVMGLDTILVIVFFLNLILYRSKKVLFNGKNIVIIILLAVIVCISYYNSIYGYANGMYRLLYLLAISFFIGNVIRINIVDFVDVFSDLAVTFVIGDIITLIINGSYIDGRLTIANSVNTNTFGMSCAQLMCILFVSAYILKHRQKLCYSCFFIIFLMGFMSGSRGALLAGIASCALTVLVYEKMEHRLVGTLLKLAVVGVIGVLGLSLVLPFLDVDLSRLSFKEMFSSEGSGTSRLLILTSVFSYIMKNKMYWFGYGPGHECSKRLIRSLIVWKFAHTHNTVFESFGELGIGGLLGTLICMFSSLHCSLSNCKVSKESFVIFGALICLFLNGMAESYFCESYFWILLAVARNRWVVFEENDLKRGLINEL